MSAVATTTQRATVINVDAKGQPLRPAIVWLDQRRTEFETGYGLEGEDRDRAGYDIGAFWARSGLAHTMVPPGEMPPGLRSGWSS